MPTEVLDFAEKYSATFFDIEDVEWFDCGELCTFDVLVDEFGLLTKPLKQLAGIVRGADINHHDIAPKPVCLPHHWDCQGCIVMIWHNSILAWHSVAPSIVGVGCD